MYVSGRHHPPPYRLPLEDRELVSFEVELGDGAEAVAVDRVTGVTEAGEEPERRLDVRAGVALLDLDEHLRPQPAQGRFPPTEDRELVSLDVALDEVDALEVEVVESTPLDLNRAMVALGGSQACEAVDGAIAEHRDVQRGDSRVVGEGERMETNVPGPARNRTQCPRVLRVRLEGVDEPGAADDAREQGGIGSPPRTDVERDVAGPRELLRHAWSEVAFDLLSFEIEAGTESRRGDPGEPDDCAEGVDASHRRSS